MKTLVAVAGGTVPFLLFASGLFFLFRLRGFYLLHPAKTLRRLGEKGERREALSSLAVALGGTLGVGNITGVTSALSVGGPGALFWMWCSALLSMGLHFAEVVLALDTAAPPGLPRYLSGRITKILFPLSLLFLSLTLGGGLQSAAAAEAAKVALSVPLPVTGALLALPLVFATVGGSRRIRAVSSRVIPFVTLLYALSCLGVIAVFRARLPGVIGAIFRDAFSVRAAAGGGIGALIRRASVGFRRGLLSNEGGCGTASLAHAGAGTLDPLRQGVFGIVEVATDTLLLCTLTGLAVLCAGYCGDGVSPLLSAFGDVYGRGASLLLAAAVFLFAFATAVTYCFYGKTALAALGGSGSAFPFLFALFLFLGAFFPRGLLFSLSDLFLGILAVLNLAALLKGADRISHLSAPVTDIDGKNGITPRAVRRSRRPGSSRATDRPRPKAARYRRRTRSRSSEK
ncbi:MAG: sodium:alanine symporter family protein [Clostridia bacterium]|nr:sodium:alanine symporter family protein [Clostridia bacterium]